MVVVDAVGAVAVAVVEVVAYLPEVEVTSSFLPVEQIAVDVDQDEGVVEDNVMDDKGMAYPSDVDVQMLQVNVDDVVLSVDAFPSMEVDDEAYHRN